MIRGAADGVHSTSTCENMSLKSFSHNAKSKTVGVSSAAARVRSLAPLISLPRFDFGLYYSSATSEHIH